MANRGFWTERNRLESMMAYVALSLVGLSTWWFNCVHLAARLAWDGFSPTYVVAKFLHPDWFVGDYPSGAEELLKSAPMLFHLLFAELGWNSVAVMQAWIAAEIVCLAAACLWAGRRIVPSMPTITAVLVAIFTCTSSLRNVNLARWGEPGYGWVYNFSYAAIIVATGAALERRLVLCAVALALAIVSHPVLGVLSSVFIAVILAKQIKTFPLERVLAAAVVFLVIAGGWGTFITLSSSLGGGGVPDQAYVAFTQLESFHWYPVSEGLFSYRCWERFLPFLGETLLLLIFLWDDGVGLSGRQGRIVVALATMLALTAAGIAISVWYPKPFLIKLALQRASSIYVLVAVFFIVSGLWRDVVGKHVLTGLLAFLILISVFFSPYGVPIVLSMLFSALRIVRHIQDRGWDQRTVLVTTFWLAVLAVLLFYTMLGFAGWSLQTRWALEHLSVARALVVALLLITFLLLRRTPNCIAISAFAGITLLAVLWGRTQDPFYGRPAFLVKANDYLAAQIWAKTKTPVGSIFMPEPTHNYGWRDFSFRPGFGNVREWLYAGWIYNPRKEVFDDGLARVRALGLDPESYVRAPVPRPEARDRLTDDLARRYNNLSCYDLGVLAQKFSIRYFVFDREQHPAAIAKCTQAYRNDHYLILRPPGSS